MQCDGYYHDNFKFLERKKEIYNFYSLWSNICVYLVNLLVVDLIP
jgi:hypothetical protein